MKRFRAIVAAISAALMSVALVGVGVNAAAADQTMNAPGTGPVDETYVDANGIIHYHYNPSDRPGAELKKVQGAGEDREGCSFPAAAEGSGNSATVTIVDSVSLDPNDCTWVLSIAEYASNAVPNSVAKELTAQKGMEYDTLSESSQESAQRFTSWYQKLNVWIGDPIGIHVSETSIARSWDSSGGWYNSYGWGWYSPTGWSRTGYNTIGNSTVGDTIGYFQNWAFCDPGAATDGDHWKTRLTTSSSGSWNWSYSVWASGDCSWLLSYHYAIA